MKKLEIYTIRKKTTDNIKKTLLTFTLLWYFMATNMVNAIFSKCSSVKHERYLVLFEFITHVYVLRNTKCFDCCVS